MTDHPSVSVVVPCYNVAGYLPETLDSLLAQTLTNLEIICVNDGSTDETKDVILEYASRDGRIILVDRSNGGYGCAMNAGMAEARGRYVGIVESDDYVASDMYEKLYRCIEENELDMVRSDFYKFWTRPDGTREVRREELTPKQEQYNVVIDPREEKDIFNAQMMNWTGLYRASFLRENGICHHESPGASYQENGFWFQTFCHARRVMLLPEPFYYYRQDNAASSINQNNKVFCMLDEYRWIEDWLRSNSELADEFIGLFHYKKTHNLNFAFSLLAEEFQMPFLERYAQEYRVAQRAGELDQSFFWPDEWKTVCAIMEDPEDYRRSFNAIRIDAPIEDRGCDSGYNEAREKGLVSAFFWVARSEGIGAAVKAVLSFARR